MNGKRAGKIQETANRMETLERKKARGNRSFIQEGSVCMESRKMKKLVIAAAAGACAGVAVKKVKDIRREKNEERLAAIEAAVIRNRDYGDRKAYLIGGGIAGLSAAAYLIRDCHFPGNQITVFEGNVMSGGSSLSSGTRADGFFCRGAGRLDKETYENFKDLFDSIPSLNKKRKSVAEEIREFSEAHPLKQKGRLVGGDGKLVHGKSMGLSHADRMAVLRLLRVDEKKLDNLTIEDWFKETPHIFETRFWYLWQSAFFFKKDSSLFEFRRCLRRRLSAFGKMDSMEWEVSLPMNPYESLIRPLEVYLRKEGVSFMTGCEVTDMDFENGSGITVKALYIKRRVQDEEEHSGRESFVFEKIALKQGDFCIITNGCMTDNATMGDLDHACPVSEKRPVSSELWAKLALRKPQLGEPESFFGRPERSEGLSFTFTFQGDEIRKVIQEILEDPSAEGAFFTLKDSPWLMSSVMFCQPYFAGQTEKETVVWGYGMEPGVLGNFVKKPMKECTGREILEEYLAQMNLGEEEKKRLMESLIQVKICYMPYMNAPHMPRKYIDRPEVMGSGATNLAMMGQFVETAEDMVFTQEYSVRTARTAVYRLMGLKKKVSPVSSGKKRIRVLLKTCIRACR